MRRSLFGKSTELERLAPPRASVRDALLFDVGDHEASTDMTLAERRVDSWKFAPWLLLAGHLIIATSLLLEDRGHPPVSVLVSLFAPLALSLTTDIAAGLMPLLVPNANLAPHVIGRVMVGYIAATRRAVDHVQRCGGSSEF